MAGHKSAVWISDRCSAQQKHGDRHQTCLAQLARDTAFALEHGSDDLPFRFRLWLGRVFDLAGTIVDVAASTLAKKKRELDRQLTALLKRPCRQAWNNNPNSNARLGRNGQRGGRLV